MSRTHREPDAEGGKADMWLGWVTYLSSHRGTVPPLPAPERFTVTNPEHVALARRVRELLVRAGLMQPGVP